MMSNDIIDKHYKIYNYILSKVWHGISFSQSAGWLFKSFINIIYRLLCTELLSLWLCLPFQFTSLIQLWTPV